MTVGEIVCPECKSTNFKPIQGVHTCECGYALTDEDIDEILQPQEALGYVEYNEHMAKIVGMAMAYFPKPFVNSRHELIFEPNNNIYFSLKNIKSEMDMKCKILAWLSRPSTKGVSDYWQKRFLKFVNIVLGTDFSKDEMSEIYTYLGNDCNRPLCERFIDSGYDLSLLGRENG